MRTPCTLPLDPPLHFTMPSLVFPQTDVWGTCWWHVTTQILVVLLISCATVEICCSQSEVLPRSEWWNVISMEFLHSFLRHHFLGAQVVTSRNVNCFLALLLWGTFLVCNKSLCFCSCYLVKTTGRSERAKIIQKKTRLCEAWEMSLPPSFVSWHFRLSVYKLARNALFIEHVWHLQFSRKNLFPSWRQ